MRQTEKPCTTCGAPMNRYTRQTICSACRRGITREAGGTRRVCSNCCRRVMARKRRVCSTCYRKEGDLNSVLALGPQPKRHPQPGLPYACLWCGWRQPVARPLERCIDCTLEYYQRGATMPPEYAEEEAMLP